MWKGSSFENMSERKVVDEDCSSSFQTDLKSPKLSTKSREELVMNPCYFWSHRDILDLTFVASVLHFQAAFSWKVLLLLGWNRCSPL